MRFPRFAALLAFACCGLSLAQNQVTEKPSSGAAQAQRPAAAAFTKLAALAGDWASADDPTVVVATYRVTAGGSAVMETLFPGQPHEMVTMYTRDGDSLVLTHYCSAGNQPRMRCRPAADAKALAFEFESGTGMEPADLHMHSATLTPGADKLVAEWAAWSNGKPDPEHKVRLELVRRRK